jgi:ligand-binding sensor domain-containing protein/putative methionine-R-sulfoxide reductase with GAF domain
MTYPRFSIVVLLLMIVCYVSAQQLLESDFDHYTKKDGLSHNVVTGLAQDSTGFMWITSAYGLNRYNGSSFVQFHSSDDNLSLSSENLLGMNWLDKERLAIITAAGLHIINTRTGERHNLYIPYHRQQYLYKFNMVMQVKGDSNGNIFILSRSGFYQFDKNYKLVSRFDYYSEREIFTEHFFFGEEMVELDYRRLLIISRFGLYVYDKEKKHFKKMDDADCPLMAEILRQPVYSFLFFQQKPGSLFIMKVTSDSVFYINTIENRKIVSRVPFHPIGYEFGWRSRFVPDSDTCFYLTSHFSGFFKMRFFPESGKVTLYPEKLFNSYQCSSLLRDKDNNLWVATNKGLFKQNPQKALVQVATLPAAIEEAYPNIRLSNLTVSADTIYVGAMGFGGLLLYDAKTFQFKKQVLFEFNQLSNNIFTLANADSSTLLLGTNSEILSFNKRTESATLLEVPEWGEDDWTLDLYKDSRSNIWISGSDGIYQYNPVSNKISLLITHQPLLMLPVIFQEDKTGNIWMASHGLFRYNTNLDSLDLVIDSFPFIKMPDRQVNSFIIDDQNTLWFNSNNNGLIAYNIPKHSFLHFTRSDGLPDDNIVSMIIIGKKLWLATLSGIACMDLQTNKITSFGQRDGFPDMPIVKGAKFFYDSTAQQLYLGFGDALVRYNPHNILKRAKPPQVFIESIMINGQKIYFLPEQSITTSWQNNDIRVAIGSINFMDGYNQSFAYRILKNSFTRWQQLGNLPSFSISNLSPGTYRIQVKCSSINNRWPTQIREITIIVLPPFWMDKGFIALLTSITLLLIYLFVQWRINTIRKQEKENTRTQKLIADDYKSQFELEQISNYFSSSLAGKKTEEEVLWDVTNNLMGRLDYEDCIIYLWNEDKTKMVQRAAFGPKGKPEIISTDVFEVLPGQGIVGHVIGTHQPILVNDTRIDSRYRVDDAFRLSEVSVPIIHNDELLGVLDSEHSLSNYFSERDIKILTTIATLIGNKLKQIESEESLEAKRKEIANINEQLAEARLTALQAQMNPHFVFNALNSIKRMILDEDNDRASRYLSKFASMIRMTLEHSKDIFVTLDENIEYLKAYLEMEQLRFDDSFSYTILTSENIDQSETAIPSLMIQPLVENAIWHGLMVADGDKKIMIAFTQHQNKIICTIEDNGIGIHRSEKLKVINRTQHRSHGLDNLRNRIKIMNEKYDTECSLEITDLEDISKDQSGTRVVLRFNIVNM